MNRVKLSSMSSFPTAVRMKLNCPRLKSKRRRFLRSVWPRRSLNRTPSMARSSAWPIFAANMCFWIFGPPGARHAWLQCLTFRRQSISTANRVSWSLGMDCDADLGAARSFSRITSLPGLKRRLGEWSATKVFNAYAPDGIPSMFLIAPDGKILAAQLRPDKLAETLSAQIYKHPANATQAH